METRNYEGTTRFTLCVNQKPCQTDLKIEKKDEKGNVIPGEFWTRKEEAVRGIWINKLFGRNQKLIQELQFRSQDIMSFYPDAPMFADFFETFFENKKDLLSGRKLVSFQVVAAPRINNPNGSYKPGLVSSFSPIIIGYDIVEATDAERAYIKKLEEADATPATETASELAVG